MTFFLGRKFQNFRYLGIMAISAVICVAVVNRGAVDESGSHVDKELNEYFSTPALSKALVVLNGIGISKLSCFTNISKSGKQVLSCYLGVNRPLHVNKTSGIAVGSATSTFTELPRYYATVTSDGVVSDDCRDISDSQKILFTSTYKSWIQVYMNGSLFGRQLQGDRTAVFVANNNRDKALSNGLVIPLLEKVILTADQQIVRKRTLLGKSNICKMAVY